MRKGFTLVEMLIVLAVIALLTVLTIPNISKYNKTINQTGCKAQIEVVNGAIAAYQLKMGYDPDSVEDLIQEGFITQQQCSCRSGESIYIDDGQAFVN